jgi:hypothetical protein
VLGFSALKLSFKNEVLQQQSYIQDVTATSPAYPYYGKYYSSLANYQTNLGSPVYAYMLRAQVIKFCGAGKVVALGPTANSYLPTVNTIFTTMGLTTLTFDSLDAMDTYVTFHFNFLILGQIR